MAQKNFILFKSLIILFFILLISADIYGQSAGNQEKYSKVLNEAEKLFFEKKYREAKIAFREAQNLKPDEKHPGKRIAEINNILGIEQPKQDSRFEKAVEEADALYANGQLKEALEAYESANDLKPGNTHVTDRIIELHATIRKNENLQKNYQVAIQRGDRLLENKDYKKARAEFEKALELKPGEDYPRSKLGEISQHLQTIQDYQKAVDQADELYINKSYQKAKQTYSQALSILPGEDYPQSMIDRINELIATREGEAKKLQEDYEDAIAEGDQKFDKKDYAAALPHYQKAAKILPSESYPKARITEIEHLLADLEVLENQYLQAIAEGDQYFESGAYQKAKTSYQTAAGLKPDEEYPKSQISTLNELIAANETGQEYEKAITKADQLFENESFEEAKTEYQNAAELKPEETYPSEKISEINTILGEIAATDEAYSQAITKADQLFENESFEQAKTEYQNAAELKPEETYPTGKIAEIENILGEIAATEEAYNQAITKADQLFENESFEEAKTEYQNAAELKPKEIYPTEKISEIENILGEIAATEEAYNQAITQADQLFENESFEEAKTEYQNAAELKPEETYPTEKITEINTILGEIAATEEAYNQAITQADLLFENESFEEAKTEYQKAAELKPEETYPTEKITEINKILGEIAATEEAYTQAITQADLLFENESFEEAKAEYQNAAELKPEETYPTEKITEINKILGEIAATEEAYTQAITQADQLFENESFEEAKTEYQKAAELKPEETYPTEKISEIDEIIAEMQRKQEEYAALIETGDFQFDAEKFHEARKAYQAASELFPEEKYPKEQLREIEAILLAELERIEKEYNKAIKEADRFFNQKIYDNAIHYYTVAAGLKPDETYPEEQIKEITKRLEENVVVDVIRTNEVIEQDAVSKFEFEPVPRAGRNESYVVVKARNLGDSPFRLFLNYGRDNTKNGGFVINIPESGKVRDYIVKVGSQYKWSSQNNNWISLQPEGGSVEVSLMQISQE